MSNEPIGFYEELPPSIGMCRHLPTRSISPDKELNPDKVRSTRDLPAYLIFGKIAEVKRKMFRTDWTACWVGLDPETQLQIKYDSKESCYIIEQMWRGIESGCGFADSSLPLSKALSSQYIQFPKEWDDCAKEYLENLYQVIYIPHQKGQSLFFGIPDGCFKTIVIPVHIKDIMNIYDHFERISSNDNLEFPFYAYSRPLINVTEYFRSDCPSTIIDPKEVFINDFKDTGLIPFEIPTQENEDVNAAMLTSRRKQYVVVITVPFGGLTKILELLCASGVILKREGCENLSLNKQPFIFPAGTDINANSVTFWNLNHSIRTHWTLKASGEDANLLQIEALNQSKGKSLSIIDITNVVSNCHNKWMKECAKNIGKKSLIIPINFDKQLDEELHSIWENTLSEYVVQMSSSQQQIDEEEIASQALSIAGARLIEKYHISESRLQNVIERCFHD